MRTFAKILPVALTLGLLIFVAFGQQQPPPDLILFNGKVFTSNVSEPYVEAWRSEASGSWLWEPRRKWLLSQARRRSR